MKKISCSKCKAKWDKDELVEFTIKSGGGSSNTPHILCYMRIQNLVFCPICFFQPSGKGEYPDNYLGEGSRVVLQEDDIKIHSIVVVDEFGRYMDMNVDDFKELKVSGFGDFEDDSDDHNSSWGGAGPDCTIGRLVAASQKH